MKQEGPIEPKSLGHLAGRRPGEQTSSANSSLISALTRVATVLAKAAKSSRLYPPDHEIRQRFLEELYQSLEYALTIRTEIRLEIRKSEVRAENESIFQADGRDDVVPGLLYWDGLRQLSFQAGLDREELRGFLQAIAEADSLREAGQDDLATLLWQRNFSHIAHVAIDDLLSPEESALDLSDIPVEFTGSAFGEIDMEMHHIVDLATIERVGEEAVRELFSEVNSVEETVRFTVPLEDIESIRAELAVESEPARRWADFLRILGEVLILSDDATRAETIKLLHTQAIHRLSAGDLAVAIDAFELIRAFPERTSTLGSATETAIRKALSLEMEPHVAAEVAKRFDTGNDALSELSRLASLTLHQAIPTFCEILGALESATARRRLITLLIEKGRGHVELLKPYLEDPRWYLVRNVALILGEIGDEAAVDSLRGAISHRDRRVRKEVAKAVSQCAGPRARSLLVYVLHDSEPALRRWAARTIVAEASAATALRAILESKDFEARELEEKIDFWEAYAYAGRDNSVDYLRDLLEAKKLWRAKYPHQVRAALCQALGIAGGPVALSLLRSLRKDRSQEVRAAAESALTRLASDAAPQSERQVA